jgi:23S rRNA-intervening sequence protein
LAQSAALVIVIADPIPRIGTVHEFCRFHCSTPVLHSTYIFMSEAFTDLRVWQTSMELTLDTYRYTATFPRREIYSLT